VAAKKAVKKIKLSCVGMQYRVTPSVRKFLMGHVPFRVRLEREEDNHQDPNAISVWVNDKGVPYDGMKVGYLRRQVAAVWAPELDAKRLEIRKAYMAEVDPQEGVGELLLTVAGNAKHFKVGP
jgi:hypothetical protein